MKKTFILIFGIVIFGFLSMGCMTTAVLSEKSNSKIIDNTYNETINSFLLASDDSKIVFISEKYHYIFDTTPELLYVINNVKNKQINYNLDKGEYDLNIINNQINIKTRIEIKNVNENDYKKIKKELGSDDYSYFSKKDNTVYIRINLEGQRYLADKSINSHVQQTSRPLDISIKEYDIKTDKGVIAKKILLTPLTIVGDAVVIAAGTSIVVGGMVVLAPIMILTNYH